MFVIRIKGSSKYLSDFYRTPDAKVLFDSADKARQFVTEDEAQLVLAKQVRAGILEIVEYDKIPLDDFDN